MEQKNVPMNAQTMNQFYRHNLDIRKEELKKSMNALSRLNQEHNFKLGFKGNIPFLNSKLKTAFDAFENLYLRYEIKMAERGKI